MKNLFKKLFNNSKEAEKLLDKECKFTSEQMEQIRLGLIRGASVNQLRGSIEAGWNTSVKYTDEQIEEIRSYLLQGMSKDEILEKMAKNS